MSYTNILSAQELVVLLGQPSLVVFDTRFALNDTGQGERAYAQGHIPGAIYLHLDRDLSSPITAGTGRHPLPNIETFAQRMRDCGVDQDTQVVCYDDASGMFASRCWWLLKWLGHSQVAVLDGGWPAWLQAGGTTTADVPRLEKTGNFSPKPRPDMVLSAEEVQSGLQSGSICLCDARAPERYRGDVEPIDKVAGHVPGAINLPFANNLIEGKYKSPTQLREIHHAASSSAPAIVHMCGSGVTACHNLLACAVAGLPIPKLYAGSWSHWITDPQRPVARGQE